MEKEGSGVLKMKNMHIGTTKMCSSAPETRGMMLDDDGCISLNPKFTCLGSNIDFVLDDAEDVKSRINKASKSMGVLKFV